MSDDVTTEEPEAGKTPGRLGRIYQGRTSVDFVGRKRTWFTISLVIIVLGLASLGNPRLQPRHRLQGWKFVGGPRTALLDRGHDLRGQRCRAQQSDRRQAGFADLRSLRRRQGPEHRGSDGALEQGLGRDGQSGRYELQPSLDEQRRTDVGCVDHAQGARGVDRLLHRGRGLHQHSLRTQDGPGGLHRHGPRPPGHGRHVLALRLPDHAGHRHRHPDHPRVLAL